ncbi:MAG: SCO family protein [Ignavibacteriaceae bacterium]|nr:SCO family protein [Ignavibacteriaceae bacterium]
MKTTINKMVNILATAALLLILLYSCGCGQKLPENRPSGIKPVRLLNQDSSIINFPDAFKGKTLLLSFIYTNCPDICPMTTHNMQLIQEQLKKENIDYVRLAEMSFDPARDTPHILKEFGDIRDIDYKNFTFLTGNSQDIKNILDSMNILALPGDTTKTESGNIVYFFTHTDRITLIDKEGKIRNEYRGSKTNIQQIINDIKTLGD